MLNIENHNFEYLTNADDVFKKKIALKNPHLFDIQFIFLFKILSKNYIKILRY